MRLVPLLATAAAALTASTAIGQTAPVPQTAPTAVPMPNPVSPATPTTPATSPAPEATTPAAPASPGIPSAQGTPATPASPAAAPTPVPPTVGATVYGAAGAPIGTIKAMDSQYVTIASDKGEVRLPAAGVGPGLKGPVIGLTAEQFDAAMAQATAAQRPAASPTPARRATRRR